MNKKGLHTKILKTFAGGYFIKEVRKFTYVKAGKQTRQITESSVVNLYKGEKLIKEGLKNINAAQEYLNNLKK